MSTKKIDTERIITDISAEIIEQIQEGKIKFSIFGDSNPFSNTKEKRTNYLNSLYEQYK